MTAVLRVPRSIVSRFVMVVTLGALVPMLLVGLWLTRQSAGAGRSVLRAQLEASARVLEQGIAEQWIARQGELQLLARNAAAVRLLDSATTPAPRDIEYLVQLSTSLHDGIRDFAYLDRDGAERWRSPSVTEPARSDPARSASSDGIVPLRVAVERPDGVQIGTVLAAVRLRALLPAEAAIRRRAGTASLALADSQGVIHSEAPDSVDLFDARSQSRWEVVTVPLAVPGLRLALGAPVEPYVAPFRAVARQGTLVLLAAATAALLVVLVLSRRIVASLRQLADAADGVAAGNLDRAVDVDGADEVRRLGLAFNAMTRNLRQSLTEVAEKRSLAAVGEFAAEMSHDVRNSLTAVRVDLQHAARHVDDAHPASPLVHRALDSVRRLDATVTSALRIAGPDGAGRVVALPEPIRLAMEATRAAFDERGALLTTYELPTSVLVRGNAGALEQMFLNLLLNAAQASRPGSETVVSVRLSGAHVAISIADSGEGIPASELAHVGTLFHTTKPAGTGLGVSLASRIAQAHGGGLAITSAAGRGTTATVTLPMVAESDSSRAARSLHP